MAQSPDDNNVEDRDIINDLPDHLLSRILCFLPTNDTVKTSFLSKRWRDLWSYLPRISFDASEDKTLISLLPAFVDSIQVLYSPPILTQLVLVVPCPPCHVHIKIDELLRFALSRDLEELRLICYRDQDEPNYVFHPFVCQSKSLRILETSYCDLPDHLREVSWKNLTYLSISSAKRMSDKIISKILSGSPLLKTLCLIHCGWVWFGICSIEIWSKNLKTLKIVMSPRKHMTASRGASRGVEGPMSEFRIAAPHLEELEIVGYWGKRRPILTKDMPRLVQAILNFYLKDDNANVANSYETYRSAIIGLLDKVRQAQELVIGAWCIQVLSISEVKGWDVPLSDDLKCLHLRFDVFDKENLPGIASLLGSSPRIEKLILTNVADENPKFHFHDDFWDQYFSFGNYWTSLKKSFEFMHLKTIQVKSPIEVTFLSDFIQFLLKNAKVMEKMTIYPDLLQKEESFLPMFERFLKIPRSSPHAVVELHR